jgi:hypothetical protein
MVDSTRVILRRVDATPRATIDASFLRLLAAYLSEHPEPSVTLNNKTYFLVTTTGTRDMPLIYNSDIAKVPL